MLRSALPSLASFEWTNLPGPPPSAADISSWHVGRRSIQFLYDDSRLYLILAACRTDHFWVGITITIAAASEVACPVKSRRDLFEKYPLPTFSPLFTLSRYPTTPANYAFTHTKVISQLRAILHALGVAGNYSEQSFRRGATIRARSIGILDADLQLPGRWKSNAYKRYIEVHPAHVYHVSRGLQTLPPPPKSH
ncbi:hypothetical protein FN846DRAFT_906497 [Sphaerosporella brunnea]|uniref:Uncharacterized protein n=1 Tax=Sphaerosporella brunnea TaxID=1250544 RepID=A0A5J5EZP0_9PEZI|nr:hypothetical protein FN846DRAFT_906497 [Sphaerosporella brunnea]